eukprot:TRINITY_DN4188_c0_g1::TRINITY_DN4188_c0_g1_i1::g.2102::m.2102 TRINITY_DN4188_c0_g1::TRINITY_DN4188_c0_g1_i1::g.2102  ORF type:complete len:646 (+),score=151.71,sp/P0CO78/GEM1_CRYNJ/37.11/4e-139,Miro/PF08477.8/5.3e-20,Miro/PF08477.8/0.00085,EF_assoc_2/PF08356.7/1.8e-26,EF_assoc_2/PF08356.7/4.3e+03,Ras/PF00071.17/3.2e-20,Ras/PF00071.17/2.5,EF_assoc_1/PF08355.7/3e-14,EF-hand_1/PF00036.27/0.00013,EF-hand_1/PF00036.27/0.048,EF-hand_5/PF13202.1/0.00062,EF-hand_5/PF13202.1/0.15,EF-hand_7/PF13499.1/3.8e
MLSDIRIVVLGDAGVGKSSLITTLISEDFRDNVPPVLPEVVLPPELTADHVTVHIIDTSSRPADQQSLDKALEEANVVILVYDVNKRETLDRISSYWMPRIRETGNNIPVILAGSKIDIRSTMLNVSLENEVLPVMQSFSEIESIIECSAKQLFNIAELFYFAQKSVIYPTSPLIHLHTQELKPECKRALKRIFKMFDTDKDGHLSDAELDSFQLKCFGQNLAPAELSGIKNVVRHDRPDGVTDRGLTLSGFMFLQALFIHKCRPETPWTVLRMFGYNDSLALTDEYVKPNVSRMHDQALELSDPARTFLTEIFHDNDRDRDGMLSASELDELFSTSPGILWSGTDFPDYRDIVPLDPSGNLSLEGFLGLWHMTMALDPRKAMFYLVYLGYPAPATAAVRVTKRRRHEAQSGRLSKNVYVCCVMGPTASGKTAFVDGLRLAMAASSSSSSTSSSSSPSPSAQQLPSHSARPRVSVGWFPASGGAGAKYLVLQEYSPDAIDTLLNSKEALGLCDLFCMLYDTTDSGSFSFMARLQRRLTEKDDTIPFKFFGTKTDQASAVQDSEVSPQDYCLQHNLPAPCPVNTREGIPASLYQTLLDAAQDPHSALPGRDLASRADMTGKLIVGGMAVAFLAGAFMIATKYYKRR